MNKMITVFVTILALLLLNGCIGQGLVVSGSGQGTMADDVNETSKEETVIPRIPFPVDEYKRLRRRGKGTIKGLISLSDPYGKKIVGKKVRLYLNPVTSYSDQWYRESYIGGYKMEKSDKRLFNYLQFTASNTNGKFAFYGVPSGSYYVIGMVKCGSECGYNSPRSVRVAMQVSVSGSKVAEVDLNKMISE